MTAAIARILDEVEQLTPVERVELRRCIVEAIPMSNDLTEEDYSSLAAESFRVLDKEEEAGA